MVIGVRPGPQATSTATPRLLGYVPKLDAQVLAVGPLLEVKPRLSQGPGSVPVLVAANLGIPDGPPDIKDEFVRECEVTKPFVQSLCQFVWVPLVLAQLHHGGSCQEGERRTDGVRDRRVQVQLSLDETWKPAPTFQAWVPHSPSSVSLIPM